MAGRPKNQQSTMKNKQSCEIFYVEWSLNLKFRAEYGKLTLNVLVLIVARPNVPLGAGGDSTPDHKKSKWL